MIVEMIVKNKFNHFFSCLWTTLFLLKPFALQNSVCDWTRTSDLFLLLSPQGKKGGSLFEQT